MKRCVVTGATGLVGTHLVETLLKEGWEIWGLTNQQTPRIAASAKLHWVSGNLTQPLPVEQLPKEIDAVFHLAQSEKYRDFPGSANEVFQVNTLSTMNLLDYALTAGAKHFVFASTGGVYGTGDEPFAETDAPRLSGNLGFYTTSKFCSELVLQNYTALLNVIIARIFFAYGPGQKSGMLIPRLVESVESGKPIQLQGETGIRINPIFAEDAAIALMKATELTSSEVINIGGSDVLSLQDIGRIIGECVGKTPQFDVNAEAKPGHLIGDIGKMKALLAEPRISFREGVEQYFAYREKQLAQV